MGGIVRRRRQSCGVALAVLLAAVGCGDSGPQRVRIQGSVTYEGKPVPAGQLRFEPDASRGGAGPVGFARILEGRYDTASGKGPVPGPMKVRIRGYVSAKAFAPEMFPSRTIEVDVDRESDEIDLVVPKKGVRGSS